MLRLLTFGVRLPPEDGEKGYSDCCITSYCTPERQTSKFNDKALPAGFVSEGSSLEMKLGVLSGTFQLVFFSPEAILNRPA